MYAKGGGLKVVLYSNELMRDVFKQSLNWDFVTKFKNLASREPKKRELWDNGELNILMFDAISLANDLVLVGWFQLKFNWSAKALSLVSF